MNKPRLILSREDVISPVELVRQLNRFMEPHGIKFERIGVSGIELEAVSLWEMVTELREVEGSSVNILCDNPEGPPNNAIECNGGWTDYNDARFEGSTPEECIRSAVIAYRAKKAIDAQEENK